MTSAEIKKIIKKKNVKQWEVAEFLGISESVFTKLLRHDPAPDKALEILEAIDQVAARKQRAKISESAPVVVNK